MAITTQGGWKLLTGTSLVVVHGIALFCAYSLTGASPVLFCLDAPNLAAVSVPLVSLVFIGFIHSRDKKNEAVNGVWRRKKIDHPIYADYAAPSITRQSVHTAIGLAIINALINNKSLWSDTEASKRAVASLTVGVVAIATILAMVSVLCYKQSAHWKEDNARGRMPTKLELLKKASTFDGLAWYLLMTGLIWAVALIRPALSIWASFIYCLLLFLYYFKWDMWKPDTTAGTTDQLQVKQNDLPSLDKALDRLGISGSDIWVLNGIIQKDAEASSKDKVDKNLDSWLLTLRGKAHTNQWMVPVDAIESVVRYLIYRYYGFES